ncbi:MULTISPECIES: tyrosine-type recombinase/integrase [unclassified Marinobacter]|uniref:tyrosine-type recombinase/integrase n=1 Tax=unclassified Marinobacter TaxID=83889 RepID=UPI0018F18994|nr:MULTISPECIES: tyrosine-type recombinase/integrase [unclassified Marinobacter]
MFLEKPIKSNIEEWLNQEMTAKGGGKFTPSDDLWRPDPTATSANVGKAKWAVNEDSQAWLIAALSYYAKEMSARRMTHMTYLLKRCAGWGLNVLDEGDALVLRNSLSASEFTSLRAFLKRWREKYGLAICPSERLIAVLYALRPNDSSGPCPVESMDPVKGPFTVLETQSIFDWVNDAYADGRVSIERFVYVRLLLATGARRRQIQQLVFGDVTNNAIEGPTLRMPKAKQRGFEYRNSFVLFNLAPDLHKVLLNYQLLTLQGLQREQPEVDWDKALPNVPMFRAKGSDNKFGEICDDPDLHLLESGPVEKFHKQDGSMKALLSNLTRDLAFPISERTGDSISLTSHRFRYTLGTDMSRMGYGPHAIASAMSHKNIRCVGRYMKTSPEMGRRVDDKIKAEMALVVNAFQGRLVSSATEAINGTDPNKVIWSQSGPMAFCGSSGGCHLDAPVACYTCSKFQPWVDGPHEEVLKRLQLRQQRAIDAAGQSSDWAISFDRPILAVLGVIHQISDLKKVSKGALNE